MLLFKSDKQADATRNYRFYRNGNLAIFSCMPVEAKYFKKPITVLEIE